MTVQLLRGHTSPETAYVVEDYPYGFRLRCKMRHWVEFKKGKGTRHMTQTSNPKKAGEVWNKPKGSTYSPGNTYLYLDHRQHVQAAVLAITHGIERFIAFEIGSLYPQFNDDERAEFQQLVAMSQKLSPNCWRETAEFILAARRRGGDAESLFATAAEWVPNHKHLLHEHYQVALREWIGYALAENSTIVNRMLVPAPEPDAVPG